MHVEQGERPRVAVDGGFQRRQRRSLEPRDVVGRDTAGDGVHLIGIDGEHPVEVARCGLPAQPRARQIGPCEQHVHVLFATLLCQRLRLVDPIAALIAIFAELTREQQAVHGGLQLGRASRGVARFVFVLVVAAGRRQVARPSLEVRCSWRLAAHHRCEGLHRSQGAASRRGFHRGLLVCLVGRELGRLGARCQIVAGLQCRVRRALRVREPHGNCGRSVVAAHLDGQIVVPRRERQLGREAIRVVAPVGRVFEGRAPVPVEPEAAARSDPSADGSRRLRAGLGPDEGRGKRAHLPVRSQERSEVDVPEWKGVGRDAPPHGSLLARVGAARHDGLREVRLRSVLDTEATAIFVVERPHHQPTPDESQGVDLRSRRRDVTTTHARVGAEQAGVGAHRGVELAASLRRRERLLDVGRIGAVPGVPHPPQRLVGLRAAGAVESRELLFQRRMKLAQVRVRMRSEAARRQREKPESTAFHGRTISTGPRDLQFPPPEREPRGRTALKSARFPGS